MTAWISRDMTSFNSDGLFSWSQHMNFTIHDSILEMHEWHSVYTTQNTFPEMNSEISWNLLQFPETEEGHKAHLIYARENSQFAKHQCPFWNNCSRLRVGPSTKQIEIGLCELAKKKNAFSSHNSHICLHVYVYNFHIIEFPGISWNFFHLLKITRKRSGFPGIQEISFKVETLEWHTHSCASYIWLCHCFADFLFAWSHWECILIV